MFHQKKTDKFLMKIISHHLFLILFVHRFLMFCKIQEGNQKKSVIISPFQYTHNIHELTYPYP